MPISSLKLSLTKDAAELASMALGREDDDRLTRGNRIHIAAMEMWKTLAAYCRRVGKATHIAPHIARSNYTQFLHCDEAKKETWMKMKRNWLGDLRATFDDEVSIIIMSTAIFFSCESTAVSRQTLFTTVQLAAAWLVCRYDDFVLYDWG